MKANNQLIPTLLMTLAVFCSGSAMARNNSIEPMTPIKPMASNYSTVDRSPIMNNQVHRPQPAQVYRSPQAYPHQPQHMQSYHGYRPQVTGHGRYQQDRRHYQWYNNNHPNRHRGHSSWR